MEFHFTAVPHPGRLSSSNFPVQLEHTLPHINDPQPSRGLVLSQASGFYTSQMRIITVVLLLVALSFADSVAGLKWTMPSGWKTEGAARPMRAATYSIPPAAGDPVSAECVVYFFGAGQGGSAQANLDRWNGQLLASDGKPAKAKIAKRTIHGLSVATIDASGDYTGMGGPMATTKSVQPNYRLLGAIIEGPGGNVFVKFTGPAKTVAANQAAFELLLNSFDKENSNVKLNRSRS